MSVNVCLCCRYLTLAEEVYLCLNFVMLMICDDMDVLNNVCHSHACLDDRGFLS